MLTNTVTMTTVEIAELTGKRHDNVLRDARAIASQVNALRTEAVESTYNDKKGETRPMLVLDKHLTFTLLISQSFELSYQTANLITCRLCQLEGKVL